MDSGAVRWGSPLSTRTGHCGAAVDTACGALAGRPPCAVSGAEGRRAQQVGSRVLRVTPNASARCVRPSVSTVKYVYASVRRQKSRHLKTVPTRHVPTRHVKYTPKSALISAFIKYQILFKRKCLLCLKKSMDHPFLFHSPLKRVRIRMTIYALFLLFKGLKLFEGMT